MTWGYSDGGHGELPPGFDAWKCDDRSPQARPSLRPALKPAWFEVGCVACGDEATEDGTECAPCERARARRRLRREWLDGIQASRAILRLLRRDLADIASGHWLAYERTVETFYAVTRHLPRARERAWAARRAMVALEESAPELAEAAQ